MGQAVQKANGDHTASSCRIQEHDVSKQRQRSSVVDSPCPSLVAWPAHSHTLTLQQLSTPNLPSTHRYLFISAYVVAMVLQIVIMVVRDGDG